MKSLLNNPGSLALQKGFIIVIVWINTLLRTYCQQACSLLALLLPTFFISSLYAVNEVNRVLAVPQRLRKDYGPSKDLGINHFISLLSAHEMKNTSQLRVKEAD